MFPPNQGTRHIVSNLRIKIAEKMPLTDTAFLASLGTFVCPACDLRMSALSLTAKAQLDLSPWLLEVVVYRN